MSATVIHALVFLAGIAAYTVLTAMHLDGNPVLVAAGGYSGGALIQKGTGGA